MAETVECSECGTRYDSEEHPFCPRCGSTGRGAALPGALASAARNDPGRRRVRGSGAMLLAIGVLFLVSTAASLAVPAEEAASSLVEALAARPGGLLVVHFPDAAPGNVTLVSIAGQAVANGTAGADGTWTIDPAPHASLRVLATQGNASWNRTVITLSGDRLDLRLERGNATGPVALSPTMASALSAGRYVFLGLALLLCAGGMAALLLRAWPLAAIGALMAALLGLLAVVGFLALGLLFAVPFGVAAYFILRGRRHFGAPAPPATPPSTPPPGGPDRPGGAP